MGGPGPQLGKATDAFDHYGVELIGVAHCTGQEAAAICHHRFGDPFDLASYPVAVFGEGELLHSEETSTE